VSFQAIRLDHIKLAVMASLLVARVLTPMMAAYILKPIVTVYQEPRWMKIYPRYRLVLLAHRRHHDRCHGFLFFFALVALLDTAAALLHSSSRPTTNPRRRRSILSCRPVRRWLHSGSAAEQARLLVSKVARHDFFATLIAMLEARQAPAM
jgi:hypothetical protein